uniref:C2H2-type domain-containing protein n=1 Tax=Trichobilharzia regenti TaxID=157069 RepID=A0AA85JTA7_TRIRE|nr:unnamed protein product [Trichobilharzia regenti]
MMGVTESRMCPDDEYWRHNLNLDCDVSKTDIAVENSLPSSVHSNDESQSAKNDFEMNPISSEHQSEMNVPAKAYEKCTDSPALSTASFLFCDVCQVRLMSMKNKEQHESGRMHKKQIELKIKFSGPAVQNSSPSSIHSSNESQSNSIASKTVDTQPQPTVRDRDEEIIRLLRRFCLVQTLSLLQNMGESLLISPRNYLSEIELTSGTDKQDLIEKLRTICRDELREILSEALPNASHQSRNVNT